MAIQVRVEFEHDAERTLDWPADAPLPALGYRVEIEDEPFEIVSVVLALWPKTDLSAFVVTVRLKPAFTA